ncbi:TonB-dependent siderophore receptor [Geobacter sp. SVR]|uniref:TonB-dependent receptor plug domain-containing protein n=1 Tax=Geobacter sp. SVR TaxID=2495594 RepID=UPI00143EFAA6|nr:TonB-dependent receptor [Geobacter sp. SVR]BCS53687.1 ligand-gated channel [Geobacter sp. SVR]GCF84116.1 ligand-gated TonB-dependent outer membrane channel [Geobacter sp. SVR]
MKPSTFSYSFCAFVAIFSFATWLVPGAARGADDTETLELLNAWQEQSATASRAPKPLSRTAENVTVVTSADVEALNAHTLADVLATIPGIQIDQRGGPGGLSFINIQSSNFNHVLVLVDGVPINTSGNFSDTALIPARVIERIEIVKGAASSSWGQALGGVISVTTKTPEPGRRVGGAADASLGERGTDDTGVSLSGTSGRLGYFLSGGYFGSAGLIPYHSFYSRNLFSRLTWDLPDKGQVWGTFGYTKSDNRGDAYVPLIDFQEKQDVKQLIASVGLRKSLANNIELEIAGRHLASSSDYLSSTISTGMEDPVQNFRDRLYGGWAKLTWREKNNLLVMGGEYDHIESDLPTPAFVKIKHWGVFLNDTLDLGPISLIPGVRFDRTTGRSDAFSPSMGIVWRITDETLVRGYTGLGYSLVDVANTNVERIWTTQVGMESQAIPYVWLKGTLFRNQMWHIQTWDFTSLAYRPEKQIALGAEIEARTVPVWNTSLSSGYTFTDTTRSNGSQVFGAPRHTVQLALRYDDKTYRGMLTGRHIWWNADPAFEARYFGLIWDLHLGAVLYKREDCALELFFSGHNLFNGAQFSDSFLLKPSRWFEGGVKVRF